MSSSDDIVDRLRGAWPKYPWADEAADEIERLRAENARLHHTLCNVSDLVDQLVNEFMASAHKLTWTHPGATR